MFSLEYSRDSIGKILDALSKSIGVEAAVFDDKFHLLESTSNYLKQKGSSVHIPYLEEVLHSGKALVNNPGNMTHCIGCRFKGHCPSTIELLRSITIENNPVGIISIVSFSKEGQTRLTENLDSYLDILNEISELISIITVQKCQNSNSYHLDKMLQLVMDLSNDNILILDSRGTITHYSSSLNNFFPQCSPDEKSIYHILPNLVVSEILEGNYISDKNIKNNEGLNATLSSLPLKINSQFIGSVVRIIQNTDVFAAKKTVKQNKNDFLDNIKGSSDAIKAIKKKIQKVAGSTSTVLITGETGTGKELFARAIHFNSSRSSFPFITINCASIPENLFESELFGYEEGAFTGAKKGGKPGYFELAHGGTLFLDEIGELPMYMQAKLLRVLQERTVLRVGGIRSIPVDVRIIAATNQNIKEMIAEKNFRSDLYYRLNVIPLVSPPLRERQDDMVVLAMHFLEKFNEKLNKSFTGFSDDVISILKEYSWPGNVRELENVIEYAANMELGKNITMSSLPDNFLDNENEDCLKTKSLLKNVEADTIKAALDKYGWDMKGKSQAAHELGIGLRTLYRKIEIFNLKKV